MTQPPSLVIRGGTVVDGNGGAPYVADILVRDGRIAAIGHVAARGDREIDATGRIVAPGFVDIHTHYDGQAIWSNRMDPSSWHGVTTVMVGNCGVGWGPRRPPAPAAGAAPPGAYPSVAPRVGGEPTSLVLIQSQAGPTGRPTGE